MDVLTPTSILLSQSFTNLSRRYCDLRHTLPWRHFRSHGRSQEQQRQVCISVTWLPCAISFQERVPGACTMPALFSLMWLILF